MSNRDEFARDLFIADNSSFPEGVAEKDWDENREHHDYAYTIADGLIAKGYRKAAPAWVDSLTNDGIFEYTTSSHCDGSHVTHWRRVPGLTYEGNAAPWESYEPEATK